MPSHDDEAAVTTRRDCVVTELPSAYAALRAPSAIAKEALQPVQAAQAVTCAAKAPMHPTAGRVNASHAHIGSALPTAPPLAPSVPLLSSFLRRVLGHRICSASQMPLVPSASSMLVVGGTQRSSH